MPEDQPSKFPATVQSALRRQALIAEGRLDAFRFAWDCKGDMEQLRAKAQELEELLSDPALVSGPMMPTAGPRIYRDGYLAGLRDAIEIISDLTNQTVIRSGES